VHLMCSGSFFYCGFSPCCPTNPTPFSPSKTPFAPLPLSIPKEYALSALASHAGDDPDMPPNPTRRLPPFFPAALSIVSCRIKASPSGAPVGRGFDSA
jgi:hypothetical protein